jgi:hypothetical protein
MVILLAIVAGPAIPTTVRALTNGARAAREFRALPPDVRLRAIFGWQHTIARDVAARVGPRDAVDFVMATPEARDLAVLTAPFLAPRPVRFFDGMEAWRRRERAAFFKDGRSANAPNRSAPGPAAVTVVLEPHRDPPYFIVH